jgi:hypothetical protein
VAPTSGKHDEALVANHACSAGPRCFRTIPKLAARVRAPAISIAYRRKGARVIKPGSDTRELKFASCPRCHTGVAGKSGNELNPFIRSERPPHTRFTLLISSRENRVGPATTSSNLPTNAHAANRVALRIHDADDDGLKQLGTEASHLLPPSYDGYVHLGVRLRLGVA